MAHDWNNLITPLVGVAGLLRSDLPEDSPLQTQVEMIRKAARRASELSGELLACTRRGTREPERLDVSALVADLQPLLEAALGPGAALRLELGGALPEIEADPGQTGRIIVDLLATAQELSAGQVPRVWLRTFSSTLDRGSLRDLEGGLNCEEGEFVGIEVELATEPLPPRLRDALFDRFFATKHEELGWGLSACLARVESERGAMRVTESKEGSPCLQVLLPCAPIEDSEPERSDVARSAKRDRPPCLLVVDDDEGARELTAILLDRAGYPTDVAADGVEAIAIFRARREEIDAVVLDLTMPGMSGAEVFETLRQIEPDLPIVVVSGYAVERIPETLRTSDAMRFLRKPFEPEQLVQNVRALVGGSGPSDAD